MARHAFHAFFFRYSFPEALILIALNLLPDADIKREFSKCFTRHYTRVADLLLKSTDLDQLSNRLAMLCLVPICRRDSDKIAKPNWYGCEFASRMVM